MSLFAAVAQPSAVKDAAKKLYRISSTDASGRQRSSVAVPVSADEIVCLWSAVKDAEKAVVTSQKGKSLEVTSIIGCDDIYDLCKLRVDGAKFLPVVLASNARQQGSSAWLSDGGKDGSMQQLSVGKVESFADSLSYYILNGDAMATDEGLAVIAADGNVLGLTHLSGTPRAIHSADLRLVASITTDGLSLSHRQLAASKIPVDIPRNADQARVFLLMAAQQSGTDNYSRYAYNFVRVHPQMTDGYVAVANLQVADSLYAQADATMADAVKNCADKGEAQYEWGKLVYTNVVYNTDTAGMAWTFDDALSHIDKAISADPDPTYTHLKAQTLYAQGKTQEALNLFSSLLDGELRGSELFYEIAQCHAQLGSPDSDVVALLDSAVAAGPQPLGQITAPYVLARGEMLDRMGETRRALADYNLYDSLMVNRASADFYFLRHECELKLRQYQPALNDLAHAAVLEPGNPAYIASMASLQLRLNRVDDALRTTELALSRFPDYSVLHVVRGLALIHNEKKDDGIVELKKAEELGNEQAAQLIEHYK